MWKVTSFCSFKSSDLFLYFLLPQISWSVIESQYLVSYTLMYLACNCFSSHTQFDVNLSILINVQRCSLPHPRAGPSWDSESHANIHTYMSHSCSHALMLMNVDIFFQITEFLSLFFLVIIFLSDQVSNSSHNISDICTYTVLT